MKKDGFDAFTTWVDRLSRRVNFIKSMSPDTEDDVTDFFFEIFLRIIVYRTISYQIVSPSSDTSFGGDLWDEVVSS